MRLFLTALLISIAPTYAHAQAFGISPEMSPGDLRVIEQNSANSYWVEVPAPNENFDHYLVTVTTAGVCSVSGVNMSANSFLDIKQAVDRVLRENYGQPTREAELASVWEGLRPPLEAIMLAAYSDGLMLSYQFTGSQQCAAADSIVDRRGL